MLIFLGKSGGMMIVVRLRHTEGIYRTSLQTFLVVFVYVLGYVP